MGFEDAWKGHNVIRDVFQKDHCREQTWAGAEGVGGRSWSLSERCWWNSKKRETRRMTCVSEMRDRAWSPMRLCDLPVVLQLWMQTWAFWLQVQELALWLRALTCDACKPSRPLNSHCGSRSLCFTHPRWQEMINHEEFVLRPLFQGRLRD